MRAVVRVSCRLHKLDRLSYTRNVSNTTFTRNSNNVPDDQRHQGKEQHHRECGEGIKGGGGSLLIYVGG